MARSQKTKRESKRNGGVFDSWSIVHLTTGVLLGWLIDPFIALAIMVLWEPLEILILSPLLKRAGIIFGYESCRNSSSVIFFNVIGVTLGAWALTALADPPFHLF